MGLSLHEGARETLGIHASGPVDIPILWMVMTDETFRRILVILRMMATETDLRVESYAAWLKWYHAST